MVALHLPLRQRATSSPDGFVQVSVGMLFLMFLTVDHCAAHVCPGKLRIQLDCFLVVSECALVILFTEGIEIGTTYVGSGQMRIQLDWRPSALIQKL
jgi:hypothetical protein